MPSCRRILLGALVCLAGCLGIARDPGDGARPAIRVFNERDGFPQNTVEALAQDGQGRLWAGSQEGALVYDGRAWEVLDMPQPQKGNWVHAIQASRDGSLWFGTLGNGLHHWRNGAWESWTAATGHPVERVGSLLEIQGPDGSLDLYVGTHTEGLLVIRRGRMEPVPVPWGGPPPLVNALAHTPDGCLWVGTSRGLWRRNGGQWTRFGQARGQLPAESVSSLAVEDEGGLWVGTSGGLAAFRGGGWFPVAPGSGLPEGHVDALDLSRAEDGSWILWAGTDAGLACLDHGRWTLVDARSGLPSNRVHVVKVLAPRGGMPLVWAGTFAGLVRMAPGMWRALTAQSGLSENVVFSILEGPDGSFWFGTGGGGINRFKDGRWTCVDQVEGRPFRNVHCLADLGGGRILAGGREGRALFEGGRWTAWKPGLGLPDLQTHAYLATRDAAGRPILWVATRAGLGRWDGRDMAFFTRASGLSHDFVTCLLETRTPEGTTLWAGTRGGGICALRDGKWTSWGEREGLASSRITSLLADRDPSGTPRVWVATQGGGVGAFDPDHPERPWRFLGAMSHPALPSSTVMQMVADRTGRLYFFTNRGVSRLQEEGASGPGRIQGRITTFAVDDGLPSTGCTMGSAFLDSRGRVWTGTVAGVGFLDPRTEPTDAVSKPLVLGRAFCRPSGRTLVDGGRLSTSEAHLTFRYALHSYYREGDTRYKVQLEGLDPAPSDWLPEGVREYALLPRGDYVFKVWARDHAGNPSGPVSMAFSVRPPPWASPWAYGAYGLLCAFGLWGAHRLRVRLLQARNRLLAQRVAKATASLREREAALQVQARTLREVNDQKDRLLGLVAHDLRSPLHGIVLASQLLEVEEDPGTIKRFARRIQDEGLAMGSLLGRFLDIAAIEAGRIRAERTLFSMRELMDQLLERYGSSLVRKGLVLVLEMAEGPLEVHADRRFTQEILDNLLSNAIKFSPPGGEVGLRVGLDEGGLHLRVRDEGPGLTADDRGRLFERFQRLSARPTGGESSVGLGLSIVKHMVEAMEGRIRVESEPGRGATFQVDLPGCLRISCPAPP